MYSASNPLFNCFCSENSSRAAAAADFGNRAPAPYAPTGAVPQRVDFGGAYVGIDGSLSWTTSGQVSPFGSLAPFNYVQGSTRIGGGGFAGYGAQMGQLYVGGEVSANYNGAQAHVAPASAWAVGNQRISFEGDARVRLGYVLGLGPAFNLLASLPSMVYLTGGLTTAEMHRAAWVTPIYLGIATPYYFQGDRFEWGATIGAGIETAVSSNVSLRAEYKFGEYFDARAQTHKVSTGISYHF